MHPHLSLQNGVVGQGPTTSGPAVPKFKEGDGVEAYLQTFEKLGRIHQWPESLWATRLAGYLSAKAKEAYARLGPEHSEDYKR